MLQRTSLVSAALLSLLHLPAYAQTVTIQNAEQTATVSGSNNQVYQTINQTIINRPGRGWINQVNKKDKPDKNRPNHTRNDRDNDEDDDDDRD